MKRFFFLMILSASISSYSQLKFVEMPDVKVLGSVNGVDCRMIGDVYTFTFRDAKYLQIDSYKSFDIPTKDFNEFFVLLFNGFEHMPKKAIWIDLGNDLLAISYRKSLGVIYLNFSLSNKKSEVVSFSNSLTKRQLRKLFGIE